MPTQRNARKRDMSSRAMTSPPTMASTSVMAEMISVICRPAIRKSKLPQTVSQRNWYLNMREALRRHDRIELVLLGVLQQPAVELDGVDEEVDVVQPDLVARRHDVGVGRHRELVLGQDVGRPVELVGDFDRRREVGEDGIDTARHQ